MKRLVYRLPGTSTVLYCKKRIAIRYCAVSPPLHAKSFASIERPRDGTGATGNAAWWQFHRKANVAEVLRQIRASVNFPGETMIINVDGENYRFGRKFFWMRGARIQ